jgi:hypothetical protein
VQQRGRLHLMGAGGSAHRLLHHDLPPRQVYAPSRPNFRTRYTTGRASQLKRANSSITRSGIAWDLRTFRIGRSITFNTTTSSSLRSRIGLLSRHPQLHHQLGCSSGIGEGQGANPAGVLPVATISEPHPTAAPSVGPYPPINKLRLTRYPSIPPPRSHACGTPTRIVKRTTGPHPMSSNVLNS